MSVQPARCLSDRSHAADSREQGWPRDGVRMLMPQEKMQDAGAAAHESVGLGRGGIRRRLPRLARAPVKKSHQHIGNIRRALPPALLFQHAMRLEIDLADARETVALPQAVAPQLQWRGRESASQVLLRDDSGALSLRDAQPAERNAGRSVTPPDRAVWT